MARYRSALYAVLVNEPLAFLLTFRTYGTWLHGDDRGSVDALHNEYGSPLLPRDARRKEWEATQLKATPMVFDDAMKAVVEAAIADHCRYRKWDIVELAVRSNHVHLVIAYAGLRPEAMMGQLKARATRWLRERGLVDVNQPVWVDGPGSRRYLWNERDIVDAAAYVREAQDIPH